MTTVTQRKKWNKRATHRAPIPNRANVALRYSSRPGGRWQLQEHDGTKGTSEHDPWFDRGPPLDERPEDAR